MEPSQKQVFVLGATNIDFSMKPNAFPKPGELLISPSFKIDAGGKANGQASALAKLGIPTYFISCIGKTASSDINDVNNGDLIDIAKLSQWEKLGLNTKFVERRDGRTGVTIITVAEGSNTIIEFMGNNDLVDKSQIDRAFKSAHDGDYFLLTYEAKNLIEYALTKAKQKGMTTILSPAPVPNQIERLDLVDYLVVYESELRQITGVNIEGGNNNDKIDEAYQFLLRSDNPNVKRNPRLNLIVCLGPNKGSLYVNHDGLRLIRLRGIEIVDKTLSRAAFVAGFVSRLSQKRRLDYCLKFANAAMAFCAGKQGAIDTLPTDQDALKIMEEQNRKYST